MATAPTTAIDLSPEQKAELEKKIQRDLVALVEQSQSITIVDQASYEAAGNMLKDRVKPLLREIDEYWDRDIAGAHALHKSLVGKKKELTAKLEKIESEFKGAMAKFVQAEEAKAAEAQKLLQEQQDAEHRKSLEHTALEAIDQGANEEEVDAIMATKSTAPTPIVRPGFQKLGGVVAQKKWKAEVLDLKALCRAVADGKAPEAYVEANMTALRKRAQADGPAFNVPGCKATQDTGITIRS